MDDLGLTYERVEPGRHRHPGSGRKGLAIGITIIVLLLGCGVWWGADKVTGFFTAADYASGGTGEVQVQIKQGDLVADIANNLYRQDVVKSAKAFIEAAKVNPQGLKIQPGTYRLRKQMRAQDALATLLSRDSEITMRVTIREGLSYKGTFAELEKATKIPVAEFEAAAKDPEALGVPAFWFQRNDGKPVEKSIEGFLFPDTYEFEPESTATSILKTMVLRFNQEMESLDFINRVQKERQIAPFEALIVASLAQVESGNAEDLGKVARVAYNRAYKQKMPLQFDVTANYWLLKQGKATKSSSNLTDAELNDPANPYNTGPTSQGLPAGPISNPGKAALVGAMDPPPGDWVFFVAVDKEGHSAFAVTDAEHGANIRKACTAGVLSGSMC